MSSNVFLPSIFEKPVAANPGSGLLWFLGFFVFLLAVGFGMYLTYMYWSGSIATIGQDVGAEQIRALKENK